MGTASTRRLLLGSLLIAALLLAAFPLSCDDGEEGEETPTATAETTPGPPLDIREIDFSQQSDVQKMLRRLGGEVVPEEILYADLTDDGEEEAVVPISSGGTAGNLAFLVFGRRDGELVTLLSEVPEEGSVRVELKDGQLVEMLPVYASGDPSGFPSQIKEIYYAWDGEALVVEREKVVDNPNAPPRE